MDVRFDLDEAGGELDVCVCVVRQKLQVIIP